MSARSRSKRAVEADLAHRWTKLAERRKYLMIRNSDAPAKNGVPPTSRQRVQQPRRIDHGIVRWQCADLRHDPDDHPNAHWCTGGHPRGENGQAKITTIWGAEQEPLVWQELPYLFYEWREKSSIRGEVERSYARLKDNAQAGLSRGRWRLQGLTKATLAIATASAVHNLHVWANGYERPEDDDFDVPVDTYAGPLDDDEDGDVGMPKAA